MSSHLQWLARKALARIGWAAFFSVTVAGCGTTTVQKASPVSTPPAVSSGAPATPAAGAQSAPAKADEAVAHVKCADDEILQTSVTNDEGQFRCVKRTDGKQKAKASP